MSLTVGHLVGYIDLNDSKYNSKLDAAGGKWSKFAGGLATAAAAGVAAAGAALAGIAKLGYDEMMEASGITAQLEAGIKSTGNAANVTVDGMNALASSIQAMSGQTDDSIAQTQALLMTFTNIRNVGADKIFDQATLAAANMAAKLGGDASSNAMQLGKALNDPVKGVAALTRVGVQFTDAQKDSIAAMVEAGDVMGAQKVILGELETQFGGAAEAAGKSLPGQMARLKRSFEDVAQGAMERFLPSIQKALGWLLDKMPAIQDVVGTVFEKVGEAFGAIGSVIGPVIDKLKESGLGFSDMAGALGLLNPMLGLFKEFWPQLQPVLVTVVDMLLNLAQQVLPILTAAWQLVIDIVGPILDAFLGMVMRVFPTILATIQSVMDMILPLIQGALAYLQKFWDEHGAAIMKVVEQAFGYIQAVIEKVMPIIQAVVQTVTALIAGDWDTAWSGIKDIFAGVWDLMKTIVTGGLKLIRAVIAEAWQIIKSLTADVWGQVAKLLSGIWRDIVDAFSGMWDSIAAAWDTAATWIADIPTKIKGFFSGAIDWLKGIGRDIIQGLWDGMTAIWDKVIGWLEGVADKISGAFSWVLDIFSPSKVMYKIGENIMEGLRLGMVDTAPGVLSAASNIAAATVALSEDALNRWRANHYLTLQSGATAEQQAWARKYLASISFSAGDHVGEWNDLTSYQQRMALEKTAANEAALYAQAGGGNVTFSSSAIVQEIQLLREEFRRQNDRYLLLKRAGAVA